jgi:hypothetical protein
MILTIRTRKGVSPLLWIFAVLAVLMFSGILIGVAQKYNNSNTVFEIGTAEDVVMMVNTLVGVPGEAEVIYPNNVSGYGFLIESGSISLWKTGDKKNQAKWITRSFFLPEGYTAQGSFENNDGLCLDKKKTPAGVVIQMKGCDYLES